jgi:hypothetical protein
MVQGEVVFFLVCIIWNVEAVSACSDNFELGVEKCLPSQTLYSGDMNSEYSKINK